jgi:tripartite-type tricarboxylate transporter receptor subunit TctC
MKKVIIMLAALLSVGACVFANGTSESSTKISTFKGKNVRVVIGSSSTGGDSYLIADITSRYLAKELDCNIKVDAVGAAAALDTITTTKPDGNTIMMFHDMTYLGVLFGSYDNEYSLENFIVGPEVVQNPTAGWASKANAPYENLAEVPAYLKANPDAIVRMACEAGGVSQIGFVAYYEWLKANYSDDISSRVVVVIGGSTADKCQMLWDDNCDIIFADYTSLLQYTQTTDPKIAMKFMGLLDNVDGVDVPSYTDLGIDFNGNEFRFSKDFLIYLPKDFPQSLIDELNIACKTISTNPDFKADLKKMYYRPAFKNSADAKTYIYNKRATMDILIKNAPSLDDLVQQ